MSVITKDLGAISAYGLALEAGFEGTEQEYAELLASYGTVAEEAGTSAAQAAQAANAAGQVLSQTSLARDAAISAKDEAVAAKDLAAQAANVAGRYEAQAQAAKTGAESAQAAAESAKDSAVGIVDDFGAEAQQALDSVNEAGANWKSLTERQAGNSEAWAVGQRGGVDVGTQDATYHNNAKYYAEQTATDRTTAQTAATNASQSAQDAAASASQAAESARTLTIDPTLTQAGQAADAKETGDKFDKIDSVLTEKVDIDLSSSSYASVIISTSNVWSNVGTDRRSWFVSIPDTAKQLIITANSESNAVIAFLKTTSHVSGEAPDYATGSGRTVIPVGTAETFDIPDDAKYIYVLNFYREATYVPEDAKWIQLRQFAPSIPLGLHEMPDSNGVLNMIKRCRQMTDIEWTPAVDLKRLIFVQREMPVPDTSEAEYYLGTFKAGNKYKGIPYGRVSQTVNNYGYDYGTVGHYIDFETFISSVSNSESRMCKENVGSPSMHRSVVYATVCSGFTCYALNVPEVATASIPSISGLTPIGKINDNGILLSDNLIKIGDVLNKANVHTAIITDIIRDAEGVIQKIEISEATVSGLADRNYSDGQVGGLCRRKGWNRDLFFRAGWWGDYTLYRYTKASEIPYTPSPYVNVGDEFDDFNIEHFPVMPYEGNAFIYKTGYIPNNVIKILISLNGYAYLKVFKDGVEITGSPFAVTGETESIDVTEIASGEYSAYLCNISNGNVINLTYPCHWTIQ